MTLRNLYYNYTGYPNYYAPGGNLNFQEVTEEGNPDLYNEQIGNQKGDNKFLTAMNSSGGGGWAAAIGPAATNIANAFTDTESSTAERVAGAMGIAALAKQWTADTSKGDAKLREMQNNLISSAKPNYIQDASSTWGANNAVKLNSKNIISPISSVSGLPSLKDFKGNWWRNMGASVVQGAASGSVGGPWGALGGAVTGLLGSIGGLFGRTGRAQKAYDDFLAKRRTLMSAQQSAFDKAVKDQTLSNMQALANGNTQQRINDMANIRAYGGNLFDDGGDLTEEQQMVLADIQADPRILFTPKYSQWRDYIRRTSPDYLDRLYTSLPYEQQQDIYQNDREAWGALSNKAKGDFGGTQVRKKTDEVSPYVAGALGLVGAAPAMEAVAMFPMLENGLNAYFGYEGAKNLPTAVANAYDYAKKGDWSRAGLSAGEAVLDGMFLGNGIKGVKNLSESSGLSNGVNDIKNAFYDVLVDPFLQKVGEFRGYPKNPSLSDTRFYTEKPIPDDVKQNFINNVRERYYRNKANDYKRRSEYLTEDLNTFKTEDHAPSFKDAYENMLSDEISNLNRLSEPNFIDNLAEGTYYEYTPVQASLHGGEFGVAHYSPQHNAVVAGTRYGGIREYGPHEIRHRMQYFSDYDKPDVLIEKAFTPTFDNAVSSKYGLSSVDASLEKETTLLDTRNKIIGDKMWSEHIPLEEQIRIIDSKTDKEILKALEDSNGYGYHYVKELKKNPKEINDVVKSLRDALKYSAVITPPIIGGLSLNNNTKAMGGNLYTDLSPNMMSLWNNKQQIDQQKVNMQQMNFGLGNSFNQKINRFDGGGWFDLLFGNGTMQASTPIQGVTESSYTPAVPYSTSSELRRRSYLSQQAVENARRNREADVEFWDRYRNDWGDRTPDYANMSEEEFLQESEGLHNNLNIIGLPLSEYNRYKYRKYLNYPNNKTFSNAYLFRPSIDELRKKYPLEDLPVYKKGNSWYLKEGVPARNGYKNLESGGHKIRPEDFQDTIDDLRRRAWDNEFYDYRYDTGEDLPNSIQFEGNPDTYYMQDNGKYMNDKGEYWDAGNYDDIRYLMSDGRAYDPSVGNTVKQQKREQYLKYKKEQERRVKKREEEGHVNDYWHKDIDDNFMSNPVIEHDEIIVKGDKSKKSDNVEYRPTQRQAGYKKLSEDLGGSEGVKHFQEQYNAYHPESRIKVDGKVGDETVRAFQSWNNEYGSDNVYGLNKLNVDGIYGEKSQEFMSSGIAKRNLSFANGGHLNIFANKYDFGGSMNGMDLPTGMQSYENGGTHEENPYGGIQVGVDQQGNPNLVEEGEFRWGDYVFSDRINVDPTLLSRYNLAPATKHQGKKANKGKLSYADMAKKYAKKNSELANDPIGKNTLEAYMKRLQDAQEDQKFQDSMEQQKQDAINQYRNALSTQQQGNPMYGAMKYNGMGNAATQQGVNAGMSDLGQQGGGNEVLSNTNRSGNNMLHAMGGNLYPIGGWLGRLFGKRQNNQQPSKNEWGINKSLSPWGYEPTFEQRLEHPVTYMPHMPGDLNESLQNIGLGTFNGHIPAYDYIYSPASNEYDNNLYGNYIKNQYLQNKYLSDMSFGSTMQPAQAQQNLANLPNGNNFTFEQWRDMQYGNNNSPYIMSRQEEAPDAFALQAQDRTANGSTANADYTTGYNGATNTNTGGSGLTGNINTGNTITGTYATNAFKEDREGVPLYSTAGKFATFGKGFTPMLYDWMNKTNFKYDPNQRPANELVDMGNNSTFLRTADTIGGYRAPNLMDAERMNNAAQAQGLAALQAALSTGNGNRGFAAAQANQQMYNTGMGIGNNYATAQQANNEERFKNDSFNTALDQANANIRNSMYQDNQKGQQIGQQMKIDTKKAANDYLQKENWYADRTNRTAMDNRATNQAAWTDNALNYFITQAQENAERNRQNNDITKRYWSDKDGVMHYIGDSGLNGKIREYFRSHGIDNGTFRDDRLAAFNSIIQNNKAKDVANENGKLWSTVQGLMDDEIAARNKETADADKANADELQEYRDQFDSELAQLQRYGSDKMYGDYWRNQADLDYYSGATGKFKRDEQSLSQLRNAITRLKGYNERYNKWTPQNVTAYGGRINNGNKNNKNGYYTYTY